MGTGASKHGRAGVYETSWLRTLESGEPHRIDVSVTQSAAVTGDQSRQVPAAASDTDTVFNPAENGQKADTPDDRDASPASSPNDNGANQKETTITRGAPEVDSSALQAVLGEGARADYAQWVVLDFSKLLKQPFGAATSAPFQLAGFSWQLHIVAGSALEHVVVRLRMLNLGLFSFKRNSVRLRLSLRCRDPLRTLHVDACHRFRGRSSDEWNSGGLLVLDQCLDPAAGYAEGDLLAGDLVLFRDYSDEGRSLWRSPPPNLASTSRPLCTVGFSHSYVLGGAELLSTKPKLVTFKHFLSDTECAHLVAMAGPNLKRSLVSGRAVSENRTSWSMFMTGELSDDPIVAAVERRCLLYGGIIGTRLGSDRERLQIIRYLPGERFKPHYDNEAGDCTKRAATILMFLSDVDSGGETYFPKGSLLRSETVGFGVKPAKGKALMFWSRTPQGQEDPCSLHAGSRVLEGEKWVASKWLTMY